MGKIFCLMGKSASGKDSIYSALLNNASLGLRRIVLYSTRPIRSGEIDGMTYHFCSDDEADAMLAAGQVIEMRAYHTMHGLWRYFTANDGQIDLTLHDYLLIGTLEAYERFCAFFGSDAVVPLYVRVDDGVRLQRALDRERAQNPPRYAEMCRRFLADEDDFSEAKLAQLHITKQFENKDFNAAVAEIAAYIRKKQKGIE